MFQIMDSSRRIGLWLTSCRIRTKRCKDCAGLYKPNSKHSKQDGFTKIQFYFYSNWYCTCTRQLKSIEGHCSVTMVSVTLSDHRWSRPTWHQYGCDSALKSTQLNSERPYDVKRAFQLQTKQMARLDGCSLSFIPLLLFLTRKWYTSAFIVPFISWSCSRRRLVIQGMMVMMTVIMSQNERHR